MCFTGDAVLGEGSVFIAPDPGALAGYLDGLRGLRERDLDVLCPGHGPPIWDPRAKLDEYIDHRLERERLLLAALAAGRRSTAELLDAAWSDVPAELRPVAAVSLRAHLDKLEDEASAARGCGAVPAGERYRSRRALTLPFDEHASALGDLEQPRTEGQPGQGGRGSPRGARGNPP